MTGSAAADRTIDSTPAGQCDGALRATASKLGTRTRWPAPSNICATGCQIAGPRNGLCICLTTAKADGYQPITPTGQAVVHYLNPAYYRATALGGLVLNSAQPQSLVYANTPHGAVLVAAMFIMSPLDQGTPPQPGGCLTQWHQHTNLCLNRSGVIAASNPTA